MALQPISWLGQQLYVDPDGTDPHLYRTNYASSDERAGSMHSQLRKALVNPDTSWQDLLRAGVQRDGGDMFGRLMQGQEGVDPMVGLIDRLNATGWDDARKREAILGGIQNSYATDNSGWTEWTSPEAIAGAIGLPDFNRGRQQQEAQAYSQQHKKYTAQQDSESMANAMKVLGALVGSWMGPGGGLKELFGSGGTAATGASEGFLNPEAFNLVDQTGTNMSFDLPNIDDWSNWMDQSGGFDMGGMPEYTSPDVDWSNWMDQSGGFDMGGMPEYASPGVDWSNLDQMIKQLGSNIPSFLQNLIPGGNNQTGGPTNFLRGLFGNNQSGGSGGQGEYSFPIGQVINSLLGYKSSSEAADKLDQLMRYAIERSDPFASQRPAAQTRLNKLYDDPSSFFTEEAGAQVADAAARKAASMGYQGSTQQNRTVADSLFQHLGAEKDRVAHLAGAQFSPGGTGSITSTMGPQVVNQQQQAAGNLGFGLDSIYRGNQPTITQQLSGTPNNQNFWQFLGLGA